METLSFQNFVEFLESNAQVDGFSNDRKISPVSIDTRTLVAGSVYFAIKGDRFDGHKFINEAFKKGAVACVVKNDWKSEKELPRNSTLIRVNDPLQALQNLASNYRNRFDIPVIAITGTNGKTTTKEMVAAILEKKYNIFKTPGNFNNHIGLPLSVLQIDNETELAIIEMGANHFGEIKHLCKISKPTHGLITNIGAGHLEFFGSVDQVAKAKAELLESLPEEGVAFINADDPRILREKSKAKKQVTFGFHEAATKGAFLKLDENGCASFLLQDKIEIKLRVSGKHQIYNALAAACIGIHFNVPLNDISSALSFYQSYSKRMERYSFAKKTIFLDAYNSNPDSLFAALETLINLAKNKKSRAIAVLGDMLELGKYSKESHHLGGEWAAKHGVDSLFLFGNYAEDYKRGFQKKGKKEAFVFSDKSILARELFNYLKNGDVILIKGSRGMAMETVWQDLQQMASS